MKNSEYLDFSDHLGHGLNENKRQNLYTFGERTRAAQPGLSRTMVMFSTSSTMQETPASQSMTKVQSRTETSY